MHGPALSDEERIHRDELEQLSAELDLDGRVLLGEAVPRAELPALFATHDALVNNMRAGAPDKVVYEAGAACLPVLASNPIFDSFLAAEQRFPRFDPRALADRIEELAATGGDERAAIGHRLREKVQEGHSVQTWARGIARRGGPAVTDGVVLHTQKVAGISGSEAHLLQLLPDLRARGWDVRFLMLHEDEPGAWEFAEELRARGVPLDDIRLRADVDPIAFGEVVAHLTKRGRGSCTRTSCTPTSTASSRARSPASRSGCRRSTGSTSSGRAAGSASPIARSARSRTCTSRSRRDSRSTSPRRRASEEEDFEIVHYGISSAGAAVPYGGAEPRLLCVGRLIPIKGHLVLLRALAQARARVPGLVLDVAGRGPLEPALKAYAKELGVADAVRFLGFVSPVQTAIKNAAIVVVPSLGEGFGMVALEAMERERPVIASSVGGLPEIVADGVTGLVVPSADAEALADAIVALADDLTRAAEMGRAGRERALAEFTPERCVERIEALYARALGLEAA